MNKTKNNVKSVLKEFKNFVKKYKKQNPRECQIKAVETLFGKAHSKFLFNMCCGAGKTIIESFLIFKEIVDCNKNGKLARVMVASHRLLLNNQLVQIVNDAMNSNKITNVEWWSLSSNVTFGLVKIKCKISCEVLPKTSVKTLANWILETVREF